MLRAVWGFKRRKVEIHNDLDGRVAGIRRCVYHLRGVVDRLMAGQLHHVVLHREWQRKLGECETGWG